MALRPVDAPVEDGEGGGQPIWSVISGRMTEDHADFALLIERPIRLSAETLALLPCGLVRVDS